MSTTASKSYYDIDVPEGWEKTTLGKIGEYINGRGFKKSEWASEGLPIIRIQDLTGTGKEQHYYAGEVEERYVINSGDLLISWAATLGAYIWDGPKSVLNQHIFKVDTYINKKFHYYLIQHILEDLYRQTHGSGMVHITKGKFESIPIGVPDKDAQARIVAEIDKQFSRLDEAVTSLKRAKANLKRYKAAVLKAAIEGKLTEEWRKHHPDVEPASELLKRILAERRRKWEEAELAKMRAKGREPKDEKWKEKYIHPRDSIYTEDSQLPNAWCWCLSDQLFWFITSGSRGWAKYYAADGPIFLRIGNLDHNSIELDLMNIQRVKPPIRVEGTRTRVHTGDILISITADVGMVAIVRDAFQETYINQHIALARPVGKINRGFIAWYLAAIPGQKQLRSLQRGATKAGLGLNDIRTVNVPLPPLTEQNKIVSEIDIRSSLLQTLENELERNLLSAASLRLYILKQAFVGELI